MIDRTGPRRCRGHHVPHHRRWAVVVGVFASAGGAAAVRFGHRAQIALLGVTASPDARTSCRTPRAGQEQCCKPALRSLTGGPWRPESMIHACGHADRPGLVPRAEESGHLPSRNPNESFAAPNQRSRTNRFCIYGQGRQCPRPPGWVGDGSATSSGPGKVATRGCRLRQRGQRARPPGGHDVASRGWSDRRGQLPAVTGKDRARNTSGQTAFLQDEQVRKPVSAPSSRYRCIRCASRPVFRLAAG
jgi:hypothetical protein